MVILSPITGQQSVAAGIQEGEPPISLAVMRPQ
jgi:hypothetical protein